MSVLETNTKKIIARLEREGWVNAGGKKHTKFRHPDKTGGDRGASGTPLLRPLWPAASQRLPDGWVEGTNAVTRYVALVDGRPGAFGVVFPDCPGCTAMGRSVEEALANAAEALAEWAEDVRPMPKARTVDQVRLDPEVREALASGDALALVPLVTDARRTVARPTKDLRRTG